MCSQVNQEVGQHSIRQVDRVDEELIKRALKMMKGNKADALFDIQSDCFINGPPELMTHLTKLGQHHTLSFSVLSCHWSRITLAVLLPQRITELLHLEVFF